MPSEDSDNEEESKDEDYSASQPAASKTKLIGPKKFRGQRQIKKGPSSEFYVAWGRPKKGDAVREKLSFKNIKP